MISRADILKRPDTYRDRACGALIGLAIGDSFGDAARNLKNLAGFFVDRTW